MSASQPRSELTLAVIRPVSAVMSKVEAQRAFALEGRAKDVSYRKRQLCHLRRVLKSKEKMLSDAIYADVKKSKFECYAFTRSKAIEQRILGEISFGGGCINDVIMHITNTRLPFGGVGDSGMDSYHFEAGFPVFSHYKTVLKKPVWFESSMKYSPPYSEWKLKALRFLLG